ncbi:MAG TPA: ABC transporter permease [Microcoleaceae bacterium UBA10368]|jgi:ABC exporter membrane fusion protein, DevB family|nr:ABC transporter permease [Microcoleaceae cyanobacterium UBA10368]HCV30749.1 ABC transporter permease [Microcoleaceae cyanobacterium UBA9251]
MGKESKVKDKSLLKPTGRGVLGLAIAATVITTAVGFWQVSEIRKSQELKAAAATATATPVATRNSVTALGRLSPQGEVIKLSAPSASDGARIEILKVEEGDRVIQGQIIAVLDTRDRLEATLQQADKEVKVKQAELAKIQAGAKTGVVGAVQAEVAKFQAQLQRETEGEAANVARLEAQLRRETEAEQANVAKFEAQLRRETEAEQANLAKFQAQLQRETEVQQAKLARLEAQLRGEIASQNATVDRLKAELKNAESEQQRNKQLLETGAISASTYDTKRLAVDTANHKVIEAQAILKKTVQTLQQEIVETQATIKQTVETGQQEINQSRANLKGKLETGKQEINGARAALNQKIETGRSQINQAQAMLKQKAETGQAQINQAKANLDQIAEVRPEDVQAAQAAVESAIATKQKAQVDLNLSYVKAPVSASVLKVHTRQGERINTQNGIVELGRTDQMYAIAEVYETDIAKVRNGQRATVTSPVFAGTLEGKVARIGKQIGKKDVLNTDPAADTDARVVEVRIRLNPESSKKVAALTNLQVEVKIEI